METTVTTLPAALVTPARAVTVAGGLLAMYWLWRGLGNSATVRRLRSLPRTDAASLTETSDTVATTGRASKLTDTVETPFSGREVLAARWEAYEVNSPPLLAHG